MRGVTTGLRFGSLFAKVGHDHEAGDIHILKEDTVARLSNCSYWSLLVGSLLKRIMVFGLLVFPPIAALADWKPEKNVEIIVGASAGGGADGVARIVEKLLKNLNLLNVTASVVNKTGGGGTIAWTYLNQQVGDAHYVSLSTPVLLTNHIIGRSALTYTDVTPIAQVKSEYIAFFVKANSIIQSGKDLIDRIKRDPSALTFSIGTAAANHNHVALGLLTQAIGGDLRKLKTVVFRGGAEGITAVLGGHVDVTVNPAAIVAKYVKAGEMKLLAVASPHRLPGAYASAPTWRELGANVVSTHWNGIIGPRELNREQTAYWQRIFAELTKADGWKGYYRVQFGEEPMFMDSQASARFLEQEYKVYKDVLTNLGLVKTAVAK